MKDVHEWGLNYVGSIALRMGLATIIWTVEGRHSPTGYLHTRCIIIIIIIIKRSFRTSSHHKSVRSSTSSLGVI